MGRVKQILCISMLSAVLPLFQNCDQVSGFSSATDFKQAEAFAVPVGVDARGRRCSIPNGTGLIQSDRKCRAVECDSDFHLANGICESDSKSCSIANGTGQMLWSGKRFGACEVVACDRQYEMVGNSCVPDDPDVNPDPNPTAIFPKLMPQNQISDASSRSLTHFSGAGNSNKFGSAMVVLAAASFSGNTVADARFLQNMRNTISGGREPSGEGGFPGQMELRFTVAAALAKMTPRIWSQFSVLEKEKIDLVVRGMLVSGAYTSATNNFEIKAGIAKAKSLRGDPLWWKGNPNFKYSGPANVVAARAFLGSDAEVTNYLNSFNRAEFANQLKSAGLTNMYETFRLDGPAGSMGARPTAAQVESAIKNWTWVLTKSSISDIQKIVTEVANGSFNKKINSGYNNGEGIMHNGTVRARILGGANALPNIGELGMATELDSVDVEGVRSSMSYAFFGTRIVLDLLTVVTAGQMVNVKGTEMQSVRNRVNIGLVDLEYKSLYGYYSYAHGGEGSNNDKWIASTHKDLWAWEYTFGQWFDLLEPALR